MKKIYMHKVATNDPLFIQTTAYHVSNKIVDEDITQ